MGWLSDTFGTAPSAEDVSTPLPADSEESISRFFRFLRPLDSDVRLRNIERRLGYTLEQLHSYPTLMELPDLPDGFTKEQLHDSIGDCTSYYNMVDTCVTNSVEANKHSRGFKYGRISGCKPHWVRLARCTQFRDKLIIKQISKYEQQNMTAMTMNERDDYVSNLEAKARFYQLSELQAQDEQMKIRFAHKRKHIEERLKNLSKTKAKVA